MSLLERLDDKRMIVVAGSGGAGKTTTSAALALALAAQGRRVAVVTIDPAKRLAQALGLEELDNQPRRVDPECLAGHGLEVRGELWAMMLDAKRTFDDLITRLAPDERTRDEVLANRIYQELSSAVAGSQEFTAVAKLYELDLEGRFDVLVLDTPPSRNALDFLDAPERLSSFFEGRALRVLLAPTGLAARAAAAGTGAALGVLRRLTGVDLMTDLGGFFRALSGLIDGFRERARAVGALLADPATAFLIVSSPGRESVQEAIFFAGKLREADLPFGGLIVNRVHTLPEPAPEPAAVDAALAGELGGRTAAAVADNLAAHAVLAARDARAVERLRTTLAVDDPVVLPNLDAEVHDVATLAAIARRL
ncbi:MAG TPA: ArsA-related P-loop ATPase [Solirubrobacteraceae bacterium]|nr:ArsA-related P-loop ATPase [Solirubrobacteraceae bacterium]